MNSLDKLINSNILLVAGVGGHGEQLRRIRDLLPNTEVTVIAEPGLKWDYNDEMHFVDRVVDYHHSNRISSAVKFLKTMWSAFNVIRSRNIDLIISTGPAMAVPVCLIGRVFGAKVIHIESWSRISSTSKTTKLILRFHLAHTVVYQYKDNILAGKKGCKYWGHL